MAIMFVDIDLFKHVNDTLGHAVGDQLLIAVAERLTYCVKDVGTVARMGGDEFLIIVPDLDKVEDVEFTVERILDYISQPIMLEQHEFHVTASIGVTGYPDDGNDPHLLLSNADAAMYKAKESGRNTYQFFTQEMNQLAVRRLQMESELRHAIERNELSLHFQPQLSLMNNRIIGAEALLRWNNARLGQVPPSDFIPLAEDTGLIEEIGKWVIDKACEQASRWQKLHPTPIRVSVNFSPRQLKSTQCVTLVREALLKHQLPGKLFEVEITESILLDDAPLTYKLLNDLKTMNVRLALDDFGTGYASLSYLKRFPFDVLKIDRSFVMDIFTDSGDAALCEAIIAMAARLKLEVVGEGTETAEQIEFLRQHGASTVQGYHYSKPLAADDFIQFIRSSKTILHFQSGL